MTTRMLCAGEIALCQTVFGNSIDYAAVRVHSTPFLPLIQPKGCSMAPNGQLYMYGTYQDDYSKDADWRIHFIHEMTHVWQYQNKVLDPVKAGIEIALAHKFNYMAGYAYTLESGRAFTSYNMEQQASIVEDYFALVHEGAFWHGGRCQNNCSPADKIGLYESVLKDFLKDPAYVRKNGPASPPKPPAA